MLSSVLRALALCSCLASCICALAVYRKRRLFDLPRMPGPSGHLWTGNLSDILKPNFHRVMARWAAKYGEVFRINVMGLHGVVVACPDTIARLFGRGDDDIPKHVGSYWHLDILWSEGRTHSIFTDLSTDTWRAVRRAVAPCFSASAVRCLAARHLPEAPETSQSHKPGLPGLRFTIAVWSSHSLFTDPFATSWHVMRRAVAACSSARAVECAEGRHLPVAPDQPSTIIAFLSDVGE